MKEKLIALGRLYVEEIANGNYTITDRIKDDIYATLDETGDQVCFTVSPDDNYVELKSNIFIPCIMDEYTKTTRSDRDRIVKALNKKLSDERIRLITKEVADLEYRTKNLLKELRECTT